MTSIDFNFVERRTQRMFRDDPLMMLNDKRLHALDRDLYYAWIYGRDDLLQRRIDEEGCGVVFAAFYGVNP